MAMHHLNHFKAVCKKWLYIEDDRYIDVLFGTVFANRMDTKPVWLYLVGAPGSGKTEILQAMNGHPNIHQITNLTPRTLVSGKIRDPGEPDPSLILRLNHKILTITDFSSLLSDPTNLKIVAGQLRDVFDGCLRMENGANANNQMYEGKFGIIAAVTSDIDKHVKALSSLGERFLTFRMPVISEEETKKRCIRTQIVMNTTKQNEEIRNAAHAILRFGIQTPKIEEDMKTYVRDIAMHVAVLRTHITRGMHKEVLEIPEIEVPTRLTIQMTALACGIAAVRQKPVVEFEDAQLAGLCGFGSISRSRMAFLRFLLGKYPQAIPKTVVEERMKLPTSTVRIWMEDLMILGVVEKSRVSPSPTIPWNWRLTKQYHAFLTKYLTKE